MRKRALVLVTVVLGIASAAISERLPYPEHEIANVAAFARLYGVARYFFPSDAAAELDWNRFAVHGVARVRHTADQATLRTTLLRLFSPLGPGFEVSGRLPAAPAPTRADGRLVAWRYFGPGRNPGGVPGPYRGKRTARTAARIDGFVTVMRTVPAAPLRGRPIRLRGRLRASVTDETGNAALWLRVDLLDQKTGFFDNMSDRPVREPAWRLCEIEGEVATDAVSVAFGVMASGAATADFDALELAVKARDGAWTPVAFDDAGFEAREGAPGSGWFRAGSSRTASVTRPDSGAFEGHRVLRLAPGTEGTEIEELVPDAPPKAGAHVDVPLWLGLTARVPLTLADGEARKDPTRRRSLDALLQSLAAVPRSTGEPGPDERLADVVAVWSAFRHFYPYWKEAGIDWEARLVPTLEAARAATTRKEQRNVLRRLVAEARDGHGFVADVLERAPQAFLPVRLVPLEGRLVVSASAAPEAPVGALVTTIDGVPATTRLAEAAGLCSGTDRWREVQGANELARGPTGARVTLRVDDGRGPRTVSLSFDRLEPPPEKRPQPIVELEPGIWYVDLTRTEISKVTPRLEEIARARGVVFDVRGYPGDAGARILQYLLDAGENDRWMHVARITGPLGEAAGWNSFGWNLSPVKPHIGGKVVFLSDARAISYAESVMGYVADRKLGTIVGSDTAGTNGNVVSLATPGRFNVGFTGMRVTGHDGRTTFHLVGVRPDIPLVPTVEGLRSGRDEVLERGLAVVRGTAR